MHDLAADSHEFSRLLNDAAPHHKNATQQIARFRELVLAENEKQNLTRVTEPGPFVQAHIIDCVELLRSGFLSCPAMDLGSGLGVPGIVCAVLDPDSRWVLAESEGRKADFLKAAASELSLTNVEVTSERGEAALDRTGVTCVVARAVGPVDRIYGWIRGCSTWNTLVLFKGPAWAEEWTAFQKGKWRNELMMARTHAYTTENGAKTRVIVELKRTKST